MAKVELNGEEVPFLDFDSTCRMTYGVYSELVEVESKEGVLPRCIAD